MTRRLYDESYLLCTKPVPQSVSVMYQALFLTLAAKDALTNSGIPARKGICENEFKRAGDIVSRS